MRKINTLKVKHLDYLFYDWASLTPCRVVNEIDKLDKAHKRSKRALRQQAKAIKRLNEYNERLQEEINDNETALICLSNHMRILEETIARLTEERDEMREENSKLRTTLEHAVEQSDYKTEQLVNEHELRVRAIEELYLLKRRIGEAVDKLNEVM